MERPLRPNENDLSHTLSITQPVELVMPLRRQDGIRPNYTWPYALPTTFQNNLISVKLGVPPTSHSGKERERRTEKLIMYYKQGITFYEILSILVNTLNYQLPYHEYGKKILIELVEKLGESPIKETRLRNDWFFTSQTKQKIQRYIIIDGKGTFWNSITILLKKIEKSLGANLNYKFHQKIQNAIVYLQSSPYLWTPRATRGNPLNDNTLHFPLGTTLKGIRGETCIAQQTQSLEKYHRNSPQDLLFAINIILQKNETAILKFHHYEDGKSYTLTVNDIIRKNVYPPILATFSNYVTYDSLQHPFELVDGSVRMEGTIGYASLENDTLIITERQEKTSRYPVSETITCRVRETHTHTHHRQNVTEIDLKGVYNYVVDAWELHYNNQPLNYFIPRFAVTYSLKLSDTLFNVDASRGSFKVILEDTSYNLWDYYHRIIRSLPL